MERYWDVRPCEMSVGSSATQGREAEQRGRRIEGQARDWSSSIWHASESFEDK
jgi:hypothetical protein